MKAPRIVLPQSAIVAVPPLTPRGISPRTLAYICDPPEAAAPPQSPDEPASGETPGQVDVTLSLGPSPGSCTSTTSSLAAELLLRTSCSPSSDSSASPSESGSLSSSKSLSSSDKLDDKLGLPSEDATEATSPRVPRFSSFSRLKLSSSRDTDRDRGDQGKRETGMGMGGLKLPEARSVLLVHHEKEEDAEACFLLASGRSDCCEQGKGAPRADSSEEEEEAAAAQVSLAECATPRGRAGAGFGRSTIPRAPFSDGSIRLQSSASFEAQSTSTHGSRVTVCSTSSRSLTSLDRFSSDSSSATEGLGLDLGDPDKSLGTAQGRTGSGALSIEMAPPRLPTGRATRITSSRSVDIGEFLGSKENRADGSKSVDGRSPEAGQNSCSPEQGPGIPPASPRVPRFPSLSRLRLSSREPEGGNLAHKGFVPSRQLVTSLAPAGGSPRSRRVFSLATLKRKRPPMLDIPMKESFTASPLSTPERSVEEGVEDVRELAEEGRGFAVLCKRGRRREVMEDRFQAVQELGGDTSLSFFGVFDGHGGTAAAEFAAKQLHLCLVDSLQKRSLPEAEAAVVDAYMETDKRFLDQIVPSGSSCVTCLVTQSEVIIGHAGDCRAVMCQAGETVVLTEDHKASREDERQRIEALGGHVDDFTGVWRVQGIVAITRGIGDQQLKEYIIPVPETAVVQTKASEDFVILASDGLWDVVANEEAVAIVSAVLFPSPLVASSDSENLALQLQALLSPKVVVDPTSSPAASPIVPLSKKGFRCSSLSSQGGGVARTSSAGVVAPPEGAARKGDDGATSQRRLPRTRSGNELTHVSLRLSRACRKLAELAVKRGSNDDVCVLVFMPGMLQP